MRDLAILFFRLITTVTRLFGPGGDRSIVAESLLRRPTAIACSGSGFPVICKKDSLWSVDLFRCESASLRTRRVLVAIDQYSRRIIGIPGHERPVDGIAPGKMFNLAILGEPVRHERLGKALFWDERDPERKHLDFKRYSNRYPIHCALGGVTQAMRAELAENMVIDLYNYRSKSHYPGLYRTPIVA